MKHRGKLVLFILTMELLTTKAQGFPEMIRHGYQSCTACHLSPSGGGTLNAYGRTIAKELLSHWQWKKTDDVDESEKKWFVGADVRALQLYVDSEVSEQFSFFPMQLDVEPAVSVGKWLVDGTLGYTKKRSQNESEAAFISRRHWVMFQANDEWSIRAGRFFAQFGWNQPDHFRLSRRNLGFEQGRETYNIEIQRRTEKMELAVTGIIQRTNDNELSNAKGGTVSAKFPIGPHQVGSHLLYVKDDTETKSAISLTGFAKLTNKLYSINEAILQNQQLKNRNIGSQILNPILGFEFLQGFIAYGGGEFLFSPTQQMRVALAGLQTFPFPNLEFKFEFQNRVTVKPTSTVENWGMLLIHFYL